MEIAVSVITGLLVGSFPTAYLALKLTKGVDIRHEGSKNIGAFNSYSVSKSKLIAASVLLVDLLKGALSVYIPKLIYGDVFIYPILGLIAAVTTHCYCPWLKFKGGRGLATAAGGALVLSIPIFIIWVVLWLISFLFRKNIHFANFAATILTAAISVTSGNILNKYTNPPAESVGTFTVTVVLMMLIILSKHIQPIKEYLITQKQKARA